MNGYYISNRKSPGQMGFDLNPKQQQQQLFVSKSLKKNGYDDDVDY